MLRLIAGGRNRKVSEAFVKTGKSIKQLEDEMLNGQKLQGPITAEEVNFMLKSKSMEDKLVGEATNSSTQTSKTTPLSGSPCLRRSTRSAPDRSNRRASWTACATTRSTCKSPQLNKQTKTHIHLLKARAVFHQNLFHLFFFVFGSRNLNQFFVVFVGSSKIFIFIQN